MQNAAHLASKDLRMSKIEFFNHLNRAIPQVKMSISQYLDLKLQEKANSFPFLLFLIRGSKPAKLMSYKTSNDLFLRSFDNVLERRR